MLDLRKKVFKLMAEDDELLAVVAPAELVVVQRSGFVDTAPTHVRPFIVYNFGISHPSGPSVLRAHNQYVQVWVHDRTGDYYRIDKMLDRIKVVLEAAEPEAEFYEFRMLDRSPDLSDTGLDTNVRYAVFQAAMSPGGLP